MDSFDTPETHAAEPKPGRRWFQFSLRALLGLVLICSLLCTWIAVRRKQEQLAHLQSLAAAAHIAQHEWENAQEADRTVPGCVRRGELRRLQLLSEKADLNVEAGRIEEHDNEALRSLDTRRCDH